MGQGMTRRPPWELRAQLYPGHTGMLGARRLEPEHRLGDLRRYRRVQLSISGVLLGTFAVGASLQAWLLAAFGEAVPGASVPELLVNLAVNLVAGSVAVGSATMLCLPTMPWMQKTIATLGGGLLGVATRVLLHLLGGTYLWTHWHLVALDAIAPIVTGTVSLGAGMIAAEVDYLVVTQERSVVRQRLAASDALQRMQDEDLRLRRELAEGLHGTLQHRLVIVAARLRAVRAQLARPQPPAEVCGPLLDEIDIELARIREEDVRAYSQLLYPAKVESGVVPAVQALVRRLPAAIGVALRGDDAVAGLDRAQSPATMAWRVLAVRVVEEAVTNALRHGGATSLVIELGVRDDAVLWIAVDDDGQGVASPDDEATWRGLRLLRERLGHFGGGLSLTDSTELGGIRLEATLPQEPARSRPAG